MAQWYQVNADVLNIRKGPGASYEDIGNLYKGDKIETIGEALGGWLKIKAISHNNGPWFLPPEQLSSWCHSGYCTAIDNPTPPEPEPIAIPEYLIAHFADGTERRYLPE
jgi:hypothetical protein